jgi:hypothetical protein
MVRSTTRKDFHTYAMVVSALDFRQSHLGVLKTIVQDAVALFGEDFVSTILMESFK